MNSSLSASTKVVLPEGWRTSAFAQLSAHENVLAWLEVDLNAQLHFSLGLLIVTDQRVLFAAQEVGSSPVWDSWPLVAGMKMTHTDHAGVGTLSLVDATHRIASWRFTLTHNVTAMRLQEKFAERLEVLTHGKSLAASAQARCPQCKLQLENVGDECPVCSREQHAPLSTWGLFRLWRFAKPYQWRLLAGFLLTLASTAATLVPPYLTMPLMDDVLIPFQNGKDIDRDLVYLYLGGLLGAALLAWGLGWLKTYILALVSERIGADLRTTAYEHLMRLSLEYFGGRRTGDLMNRIGAETDRICVFLSLHLLDFATDVLMILMTASILISIDPKLAAATLLPLPFIVWLIHTVRDKLRTGFEKIDRVWSELTNVLADTIPGIRVVKAFAQETREANRFRDANKHNLAVNDRINFVWSLFSPTVTLMTEVGLLVVWGFGIWLVSHNQISVGVLAAFLAYIGRFYTRLDSMSRIVSHTQKAAAGAKRILKFWTTCLACPKRPTRKNCPRPCKDVSKFKMLVSVTATAL